MCKTLSHIITIGFFVIATLCCSCDGRDTIRKNHTQALKDNGLLEQFSERTAYLPESYTETTVDTILHTGFNISIKTYTQMDSNYLKSVKKDSLHYKTYYRNARADIIIKTNETLIFNDTISKGFIKNTLKGNNINLESYVLKSVWIANEDDLNASKIEFGILYCRPETHDCLRYTLSVSKTGQYTLDKN